MNSFNSDINVDDNIIIPNNKPYKDKFYLIEINGLSYGSFKRKAYDYSDALKIYNELKESINILYCEISLSKCTVDDDNNVSSTIIHKKTLGEDFYIKNKLIQIQNILNDIEDMKQLYISSHSEADKFLSAVYHTIEAIDAEDLTEEQMRSIFKNMESKCILRRASKIQTDYIHLLQPILNKISSDVNKAISLYDNKQHHSSSDKAKRKTEDKTSEYKEIIGLNHI